MNLLTEEAADTGQGAACEVPVETGQAAPTARVREQLGLGREGGRGGGQQVQTCKV